MGFTKSQVQGMDPNVIANIASGWDKLGTNIEQKFDSYVSRVANTTSGYWEGKAAEAAQSRADGDRRVAVKLVDELQSAAETARGICTDIGTKRTSVLNKVSAIEALGFSVGEDWALTDVRPVQDTGERAALRQRLAGELTVEVNNLVTADDNGAATINGLAATLIAKFTNPASLSGQQGTGDGQALTDLADGNGSLTPDQVQRLIEAGSLTPEQMEALRSGQPVEISASQMEYLNALQNSLDGMSPEQIETILNTLPPEARTGFANTFQLVSNPRVTATVEGNSDVPTNGGFGLLPQKIQDSMNRSDLVENGTFIARGGLAPAIVYDTINVNGVGTNQAIARIAGMSSADMRAGSDLDGKVLDVAGKYLDAQVRAEAGGDQMMFSIDDRGADPKEHQITEPMFKAVADDKFAVSEAFTDPEDGQKLIGNLFQHEWQDDGETVSALTHTSADDAIATAGDPADALKARQHGDIAEAVADYMSDNKDNLMRLPGYEDKISAGELNPVLMQNLAEDLSPYYSTFAGGETIPDVGHFENTDKLANMYSVLATDPTAGVTAATNTYAQERMLAVQYGSGEAPATHAQVAGRMHDALLTGTANAQASLDKNDIYNAQWDAAVASAQWDTAKGVATTVFDNVPGAKAGKYLVDIFSAGAKLEVQGIVDQAAVVDPQNGTPSRESRGMMNTDEGLQSVVDGLVSRDPSIVNDPAFTELRETDEWGNVRLVVDGLNDQALVEELDQRYGLDVGQWQQQFDNGMHPGEIVTPSGR
jgi:hypothetical protein